MPFRNLVLHSPRAQAGPHRRACTECFLPAQHVRRVGIVWSLVSATAVLKITVMEAVSAEIRHCCGGCTQGIYQHYCTLRTRGDVKGFTKMLPPDRGFIAASERYFNCSDPSWRGSICPVGRLSHWKATAEFPSSCLCAFLRIVLKR